MVLGKIEKVNWFGLEMPDFKVSLKHRRLSYSTCGSSALSMITGENPQAIEKVLKTRHWGTVAFKNFLKKWGFQIQNITVNSVTNVYWERTPLNKEHLIVLNCHMDTRQASWLVTHKGKLYHNFETQPFYGLFLINKPIQDCFLVYK